MGNRTKQTPTLDGMTTTPTTSDTSGAVHAMSGDLFMQLLFGRAAGATGKMAEIAEELDRQAHAMMARDLGGSEGIAAIFGKAAAEDHDAKMAAAATVNRPDTPGTAMIAEAA